MTITRATWTTTQGSDRGVGCELQIGRCRGREENGCRTVEQRKLGNSFRYGWTVKSAKSQVAGFFWTDDSAPRAWARRVRRSWYTVPAAVPCCCRGLRVLCTHGAGTAPGPCLVAAKLGLVTVRTSTGEECLMAMNDGCKLEVKILQVPLSISARLRTSEEISNFRFHMKTAQCQSENA